MNLYEIIITRGYDPYPIAMRYVTADCLTDAEAMAPGFLCGPGEIIHEVNYVHTLNERGMND